MKNLFSRLFVVVVSSLVSLRAAEPISDTTAGTHVGTNASVKTRVLAFGRLANGDILLHNKRSLIMGSVQHTAKAPDKDDTEPVASFLVIVPLIALPQLKFKDADALEASVLGKTIVVSGMVSEHTPDNPAPGSFLVTPIPCVRVDKDSKLDLVPMAVGVKADVAPQASQATKTLEPKREAIAQLLPLLGHVVRSQAPITKNGEMNTELITMTFLDGRGKLTNLERDKLGLDLPSSSFIRLPELIAEVDAWTLRPDYIDWSPGNHVTWEELKRILGAGFKKETTSEMKGQLGKFADVNWFRYGRWSFGGTTDGVDFVRVYFPEVPGKDKEELKK